jgi:hypothetical protein
MEKRYLPGQYLSHSIWPHHQRMLRHFVGELLPKISSDVSMFYEVGVGCGMYSQLTLKYLKQVRGVGYDISDYALDFTMRIIKAHDLQNRYKTLNQDIITRPILQKCDFVISQEVLEHLENPQEFIASDEEDEDLRAATGERQPPAPTERQTRQGSPAINYWDTNWGRLWTNPKTEFGYTKEGKEFRQKWRVPKAVANHIVEKCKVLDEDGRDLFGIKFHNKARVPIEFKVLIALRILARGNCADDIAEMSNGRSASVYTFFTTFVLEFSRRFLNDYVQIPTGQQLQRTLDSYRDVGAPGCAGSMDCTHLPWDMCPVSLTHL